MQSSNLVGQTLGNYRLLSSLGKGGYAEVYLAEHAYLASRKKCALKVLKTLDLEGDQQEEFRAEANLMATLVHRRIAEVQDYGFHNNMPYLVMEYAPEGTLRKVHQHGTQVPFQKIMLYVKQIAEALQFAHDQRISIVHRDVKPENMLVRGPDDIILSDFGIAITGLNTGNLQEQQEALIRKMARNEHVMVPGTAAYIAPERLLGKTQRASDQYSLAIVVYEWLCGRRPFTGTDVEICNKQVSAPPPPLVGVYQHITPEIEHVVMKALAKKPEERYRTVTEFANALEGAIQSSAYQMQNTPVRRLTPVPPTAVPQTPVTPLHQQQNSPTFKAVATPHIMPSDQGVMGSTAVPPSPVGRAQPEAQMPGAPMPSPTPRVFTPSQQVNTPPEGIQGIQPPMNQAPGLFVPDFNSFASPQGQGTAWQAEATPFPQPPLPKNAAFSPPEPRLANTAYSAQMPPANQAQGQPFIAPAPQPQQGVNGWDQHIPYSAFPHGDETMREMPRSALNEIKGEARELLSKPMESAALFVETDVFFTRSSRYRRVFPLGVATNLLGMFIYIFSAVHFQSWASSIILAVIGFAIALFFFRQCLITVKKITAIAYGAVVAVWWWIVIGTLFARIAPSSAIVAGAIAFAISIGIHVWHVDARLKDK